MDRHRRLRGGRSGPGVPSGPDYAGYRTEVHCRHIRAGGTTGSGPLLLPQFPAGQPEESPGAAGCSFPDRQVVT